MIGIHMRRGRHILRQWVRDPKVQEKIRLAARFLAGFCLSAASIKQSWLPLVMGIVWASRSWGAVLAALGGMAGYGFFWQQWAGQGIALTGLSLVGVLLLADRRVSRELPLLIPSVGMVMVSGMGLGFQILAGDTTPIPVYLLRVALGGAVPWLFIRTSEKNEPMLRWACGGVFTLGLAQILPIPWLGLGYVAAGVAAAAGSFPCAAMTGLALDLSGITRVPMTAVTVLACLLRFLPRTPKWIRSLGPGFMGILLMGMGNLRDPVILPGLLLGGIIGGWLPYRTNTLNRRGDTGGAQVRLEMAAGVLTQVRLLLEQLPQLPVDQDGLVSRAVVQACSGCSARKTCRDARRMEHLSGKLLQNPLLEPEEIPVRCRKGHRVLAELRRAQEQLRTIRADRLRQQEYRQALVQQYDFLSNYLRDLADRLNQRDTPGQMIYDPVVWVYGNRSAETNGDRCLQFAGVGNLYYIVLCDGMGTGPGAIREGKTAGQLLKGMLCGGFPAEAALESMNSLWALGERTGTVTVDLVQLELDTGKASIYKWGAASSWLVSGSHTEKLGQPGLLPGLSIGKSSQGVCHLSLKKEQLLLMTSDGLQPEKVAECCRQRELTPAGLARKLLSCAVQDGDDATVVTIQLLPVKD